MPKDAARFLDFDRAARMPLLAVYDYHFHGFGIPITNDRRWSDQVVTGAGKITTRQSIIPVALVTVLFFMWRFAYGLPDVLNKHFQEVLHVSAAESAGL